MGDLGMKTTNCDPRITFLHDCILDNHVNGGGGDDSSDVG